MIYYSMARLRPMITWLRWFGVSTYTTLSKTAMLDTTGLNEGVVTNNAIRLMVCSLLLLGTQVLSHKLSLSAVGWDASCVDAFPASQRTLCILVCASNMVLAVCLNTYDEEIEDETAGEGQAGL